ncbi:MAG: carboxyl transferase domain-containing protein [Thermodesulfobacteriota bacterium]|nr:carboxyl transferase domain-containing protein [Thermodesulfobacteriota bacterium]
MSRIPEAQKSEERNREHWLKEEEKLYAHREEAYNVGGEKQINRLAKQGKKPVRELINLLIDPGSDFFEVGLDAGFDIGYQKQPHIPGGGLVTGIGKIQNKDCMIFANESRMTAGTYYPITLKKHMRAQKIAEECGLTCVYIADSGGIFLPMQEECFADEGMFGSMFYNMCNMSARGIKQYTLSTGGNTAGGAYIVYLACESIMIEKLAFAFLAGPPMVKSAIGEDVSMEDLGGAHVHTRHSGGCDHFVQSQEQGIEKLKELIKFDPPQKIYIDRRDAKEPAIPVERLYEILPQDTYRAINVRQVIKCIADESYFSEYKKEYKSGRGDTIVCGKIWLKGIPVGVIASNGVGVIFIEAARKAAEWMIRCGNDKTPLLFIQNAPGYMVGKQEEWSGIGKYGADMVRTCSTVRVPKIQWVIGPDHGAANYGMCGRAYQPRFCFQTMRARTSVMSGKTAAFILAGLERKKAKATGREMNEAEVAKFDSMMREKYNKEAHPFFTGARLFHDGVITLKESRDVLARAFELALHQPIPDSVYGNVKF